MVAFLKGEIRSHKEKQLKWRRLQYLEAFSGVYISALHDHDNIVESLDEIQSETLEMLQMSARPSVHCNRKQVARQSANTAERRVSYITL